MKRAALAVLVIALFGLSSAAEIDVTYVRKTGKWLKGVPGKLDVNALAPSSFKRGDHVKLHVLMNTLRETVTVSANDQFFASEAPDILKALEPKISTQGTGLSKLSDWAYYLLETQLRTSQYKPTGEENTDTDGVYFQKTLPDQLRNSLKALVDPDEGKLTLADVEQGRLNVLNAYKAHADDKPEEKPETEREYEAAKQLLDLVEKVISMDLISSGPYEVAPKGDLLTIILKFATTAPVKKDDNLQVSLGDDSEPEEGVSQIPSSKDTVMRSFPLDYVGFEYVHPTYSIGLAYSNLVDDSFRKVVTGSGEDATTTIEKGLSNKWKVLPAAYMHLNVVNRGDFRLGPTLGVLYSGDNVVSYFAGGSLQFGRRSRLSLNFGWQFGEVEKLSGIHFGDEIVGDTSFSQKVWRKKFIFSISYSF